MNSEVRVSMTQRNSNVRRNALKRIRRAIETQGQISFYVRTTNGKFSPRMVVGTPSMLSPYSIEVINNQNAYNCFGRNRIVWQTVRRVA